MPPRIYPRVKEAVHWALWLTWQDALQGAADRACVGDDAALEWLRCVKLTRAEWTIHRNEKRVSYVLARLRLSTGEDIERSWRVPYDAPVRGGAGVIQRCVRYLPLDRYLSMRYALGARAGTGSRRGATETSRPRSRPEIGRAFRQRGR